MKSICNTETLKQAQSELRIALKKCYLRLQHSLLVFLEKAPTETEKIEWQKKIKEVGKTYQEGINKI